MSDVDAMETDRFRALAANVASQQLKEAIHIYYDKERKQLCGNAQKKYDDILAEEGCHQEGAVWDSVLIILLKQCSR